MQVNALLEYPEFLLAGLLGLAAIISSSKREERHWPELLAQPAKTVLSLAPESYISYMSKLLMYADWRNNQSFGDFASYKFYSVLFSLVFLPFMPLYAVLCIMLFCWFLPDLILYICVKRRQSEIHDSLPQALDLMVLCVEAGLGLEATLHKIAIENNGIAKALYEELNILGRDILLGMDKERAYQELYNRTGVDELKTFGSALGQASKLGLSISRILRAQSEFIRKKQSQRIEEKALKMPIYMAFPLWFCIMPSLMLLVLGPSLIRFYNQFHSGF
jgi:pilus assembly protein TadC